MNFIHCSDIHRVTSTIKYKKKKMNNVGGGGGGGGETEDKQRIICVIGDFVCGRLDDGKISSFPTAFISSTTTTTTAASRLLPSWFTVVAPTVTRTHRTSFCTSHIHSTYSILTSYSSRRCHVVTVSLPPHLFRMSFVFLDVVLRRLVSSCLFS